MKTIRLVQLNNYLSIGPRAKMVAAVNELLAKSRGIINSSPLKTIQTAPSSLAYRLTAASDIDDGESTHADANSRVPVVSVVIRSAVDHCVAHPPVAQPRSAHDSSSEQLSLLCRTLTTVSRWTNNLPLAFTLRA